MNKHHSSLIFLWLGSLAIALICSWWACSDDLLGGSLSLGAIRPLIEIGVATGSYYFADPYRSVTGISSGLSVVFLILAAWNRRYLYFLLALAFLICAECFSVHKLIVPAVPLLILGIVALLLFVSKEKSSVLIAEDSESFSFIEIGAVCLIVLIAAVLRYYALNQVVNYLEGELAPYSAGGTSLAGLFAANKGVNGPWSPLGILYYIPIYITTSLFGTTIVALRASSAFVGVLSIPLMYLLARKLADRKVALIAAFLFAVNPLHVGWGRTDIHPHGVTTWPSILLCICALNAFRRPAATSYVFLALSMALTFHQYPSGQSAALIPCFAALANLLFMRFNVTWSKKIFIPILAGIVLWFLGLPMSYYFADFRWFWSNPFTLTTSRALWSVGESGSSLDHLLFVLTGTWQHLLDVLQGIVFKAPYLFHQDFVIDVPEFNPRTVPWMLVPFGIAGFFILCSQIKKVESCIILGWVVAALIPGIFSEHAYPKRMSTFFPAFDLLAALSIGQILQLTAPSKFLYRSVVSFVLISCVGYLSFTTYGWFSGKQWRYGIPHEVAAAEEISRLVGPDTLIIADIMKDYDEGKMTYLLLDKLSETSSRPNFWYLSRFSDDVLTKFVLDPQSVLTFAQTHPRQWPYVWSRLRDQYRESLDHKAWKNVLYIFQQRPTETKPSKIAYSTALSLCNNPVKKRIEAQGSFTSPYELLLCTLDK